MKHVFSRAQYIKARGIDAYKVNHHLVDAFDGAIAEPLSSEESVYRLIPVNAVEGFEIVYMMPEGIVEVPDDISI